MKKKQAEKKPEPLEDPTSIALFISNLALAIGNTPHAWSDLDDCDIMFNLVNPDNMLDINIVGRHAYFTIRKSERTYYFDTICNVLQKYEFQVDFIKEE